ncbi:MAG: hypothetical protein DMF60_04215 [Acidobacteria bacterium]|nr:MAG: hypothetical protein DMF60_04215 [Acidobacteriota bacterium]
MPDPDHVEPHDAQLEKLRSSISDLGHQVDSYKTKTAAALGGGVFLLLLSAGAGYDLVAHKSASWLMLGVTRETLAWIAYGLGSCAIILVLLALVRIKRRDTSLDARLDQMELEYAEMLEHKNIHSREAPR